MASLQLLPCCSLVGHGATTTRFYLGLIATALTLGEGSSSLGLGSSSPLGVLWDPYEASSGNALAAEFHEREQQLNNLTLWLQERKIAATAWQEALLRANLEQLEWEEDLARRERELICRREAFLKAWPDEETAFLHMMVFRLVRIQAAAHDVGIQFDNIVVSEGDKSTEADFKQNYWDDVEVLTCFHGTMSVVAGDFPIRNIFRASTGLRVRNLCDDAQGDSTDVLSALQRISMFVSWARNESLKGAPRILYFMLLGTNVFFNELPGTRSLYDTPAAKPLAQEIMLRYEKVMVSSGHLHESKPNGIARSRVVASIDPHCGDHHVNVGASQCYSVGGLVGPAESLQVLLQGLILLATEHRDGSNQLVADASQLLRRYAESWPDEIILDKQGLLFGSLSSEKSEQAESGDRRDFGHVHVPYHIFPGYHVQGCTLMRLPRHKTQAGMEESESWPIAWLGDGQDTKWTFILALHELASTCPRVARLYDIDGSRLVLSSYPREVLGRLFDLFAAQQKHGAGAAGDYMKKRRTKL